MQRRSRIIVSILLIASLVAWRWPRKSRPLHHGEHATEVATRPVNTPESGSAVPAGADAAITVHRLEPAQRKQLGAQIAAAIQKARTARPGVAGTPDQDPLIPLEQVGKPLQAGLNAAIPLLAKCYETAGSAQAKIAAAQMTMISDPDLGTVIDTDQITKADGKPLAKELDDCLRDTIDSLELPPLGQPGKIKLEYTFKLD